MQLIQISEIFGPTIQGEGTLIGRPTVFVRTGGCDFRCAWCDTLYAVLPQFKNDWRKMSAPEIVAQVLALSQQQPILITLSGGNPALQPLEVAARFGTRNWLHVCAGNAGQRGEKLVCEIGLSGLVAQTAFFADEIAIGNA